MSIFFPYAPRRLQAQAPVTTGITDLTDPRVSVDLRNRQIKEILADPDPLLLRTRIVKLRAVSRRWRHAIEDYFVSAAPLHQRVEIGTHYYARLLKRPPLPSKPQISSAQFMAQFAQRFGYLPVKLLQLRCDQVALLEVPGWSRADYGVVDPYYLAEAPMPSSSSTRPARNTSQAAGVQSIELVHHHDENREMAMEVEIRSPADLNELTAFFKRVTVRLDLRICLPGEADDSSLAQESQEWKRALNQLVQAISSEWHAGGRIGVSCPVGATLPTIFIDMLHQQGAQARLGIGLQNGDADFYQLELQSNKAQAARSIQFQVKSEDWPGMFFNHEPVRSNLGADWCRNQHSFQVRCFNAQVASGQSKDLLHILKYASRLEVLALDLSSVSKQPGFTTSLLLCLEDKPLKRLSLTGMHMDEGDCQTFAKVMAALAKHRGEVCELRLKSIGLARGRLKLANAMGKLPLRTLKIDARQWTFKALEKLAARLARIPTLEYLNLAEILPVHFMLFVDAIAQSSVGNTDVRVGCHLLGGFHPRTVEFAMPRHADHDDDGLVGVAWLYKLSSTEFRTFMVQKGNRDSIPVCGTALHQEPPYCLELLLRLPHSSWRCPHPQTSHWKLIFLNWKVFQKAEGR